MLLNWSEHLLCIRLDKNVKLQTPAAEIQIRALIPNLHPEIRIRVLIPIRHPDFLLSVNCTEDISCVMPIFVLDFWWKMDGAALTYFLLQFMTCCV